MRTTTPTLDSLFSTSFVAFHLLFHCNSPSDSHVNQEPPKVAVPRALVESPPQGMQSLELHLEGHPFSLLYWSLCTPKLNRVVDWKPGDKRETWTLPWKLLKIHKLDAESNHDEGLLMHPSFNVPTQTLTFWEAQAKTFSSQAIRREQTLRFHSTNGVSEHKYPPVWENFPFSSFFSSPKNQQKNIYTYTYIHMKTSTLLTSSFQPLALLTLTLWSWCCLMSPEEQSLLLHASEICGSVLSWMDRGIRLSPELVKHIHKHFLQPFCSWTVFSVLRLLNTQLVVLMLFGDV